MSLRAQTGAALWASLYQGLGATGAAIKAAGATGEHGASVAMNDGLLDASEYMFEVASQPAGGTVAFAELGQATLTVAADGVYTWTYRLREDGVYQGGPIAVTTAIGVAALALAAADCTQVNTCSAGTVTIGAPGVVLAAANCAQASACSAGAVTISAAPAGPAGPAVYATLQDLIDRFGSTELAQLTDPAAGAVINAVTVTRALTDADAEINIHLARRYALPLAVVPTVLVRIACDLTRYYLWDVRASEQVRNRCKDAIALLDKIGSGAVRLPEAALLASAASAVAVVSRSSSRQFGAALLDAFGPPQ